MVTQRVKQRRPRRKLQAFLDAVDGQQHRNLLWRRVDALTLRRSCHLGLHTLLRGPNASIRAERGHVFLAMANPRPEALSRPGELTSNHPSPPQPHQGLATPPSLSL